MSTHTHHPDIVRLSELTIGADAAIRGAQAEHGLALLREAHLIASTLGQDSHRALTSALLGNLLLQLGRAEEALPFLRESVDFAIKSRDALATVTQGTILASQLLSLAHFDELRTLGETLCGAAIYRKNWLGLADAQLILTECDLAERGVEAAVRRLCMARHQLHQHHAPVHAIHLLIGRLIELRHTFGAARIDPLLQTP